MGEYKFTIMPGGMKRSELERQQYLQDLQELFEKMKDGGSSIGFVTLLLVPSLAGTGCGDRRQAEKTETALKAGACIRFRMK